MKNLKSIIPYIILMLFSSIQAAGGAASEAGVSKSPLHTYSGGAGLGAFYSMNQALRNNGSEQMFKFSQTNLVAINNNMVLFIDGDLYFPNFSWGAHIGVDYLMGRSSFQPLVGLGAGFNKLESGQKFGKELGASVTTHAGFIAGLTDEVKIRVRVPYTFVANNNRDQTVGLDISFLWSSRFSHVKKLNYR